MTQTGQGLSESSLDGRKQRSQRTRERLLAVTIELISASGGVEPTPERIADRAGCSLSSFQRHFRTREGLTEAVEMHIRQQVLEHISAGLFEGDFDARLHELVRRFSLIFETVVPFLRYAEHRHAYERVSQMRDRLHLIARAQTADALQTELASQPATTPDLLAAWLSPTCWADLRTRQGHSSESAAELMRAGVRRLLFVNDK